jgi:hypothetical protein
MVKIKLFEQLQRKGARLLIGSTLFAVSAMIGMPASASAWSEWGQLISRNSLPNQQMCLTAAASTDLSAWQASCNNTEANNVWHMKPIGGGYYNIVNIWGKCLDVYAFSHDNFYDYSHGRVTTWDCKPGYSNQEWKPYFGPNGFQLKPRHAEYDNWGQGKCLDVYAFAHSSGAPVVQWDCLGGVNQLWTFSGWR